MTRVEEVMTTPPLTLRDDVTLCEATTAMAKMKVSGAPVVDHDGKMVGILSEKDILEYAASKEGANLEVGTLSFVALPYEKIVRDAELCNRYQRVGQTKVKEAMNEEVVTVDHDDDITTALEAMVRFSVNRLPVLNDGKLVGIITRQDVLVVLCREIGDKQSPICAMVGR